MWQLLKQLFKYLTRNSAPEVHKLDIPRLSRLRMSFDSYHQKFGRNPNWPKYDWDDETYYAWAESDLALWSQEKQQEEFNDWVRDHID